MWMIKIMPKITSTIFFDNQLTITSTISPRQNKFPVDCPLDLSYVQDSSATNCFIVEKVCRNINFLR